MIANGLVVRQTLLGTPTPNNFSQKKNIFRNHKKTLLNMAKKVAFEFGGCSAYPGQTSYRNMPHPPNPDQWLVNMVGMLESCFV